jgi:nonribosomal peptide synthetase protein BlmIV
MWQDLEHRQVSGVEVQRMLRRLLGAPVLMPVVFTSTLVDDAASAAAPAAWRASTVYAVSQTPQVLLDHQVGEQDGRLVCTWDYVPAAFLPDVVGTMLAAFERRLADIAELAAVATEPTASPEVSVR